MRLIIISQIVQVRQREDITHLIVQCERRPIRCRLLNLTMRLDEYLTVLGKLALSVVIVHYKAVDIINSLVRSIRELSFMFIVVTLIKSVITGTVFGASTKRTILQLVGTIDIADITTAEDVTIAFGQFFDRAHFATMDVHLGLSEDITVGIELTALTQVVIASTATKHITVDVAII